MKQTREKKNKFPKLLRRLLIAGGAITLLGAVSVLGLNLWVTSSVSDLIYEVSSENREEQSSEQPFNQVYDCILVLGAGLRDNTPSPMLKDRLDKGIACYQQGIAPKILMSGDHGRDGYNEVQVMKQYAIDAGVPSSDIFMDHAGFSTYESLIRARDIFGVNSPVIITQNYHMYRALFIGRHLELDCIGISTDYFPYGGNAYRTFREYIARCKDVFTTMIGTKPTYGGDPISISGNGDVTND